MENAASENQMQNVGGENAGNGLPAKSLKIRLRVGWQKPSYESPGHGNLKSRWIKKWASSKSQETENEESDNNILLSSDGMSEEEEEEDEEEEDGKEMEEEEEAGKETEDEEDAGKEMEEERTNLVDLNLVPEDSDPYNPDVPFDDENGDKEVNQNENGDKGVNQNENGDKGVNQNEKKRKGERVQVKLLLTELGLRRYKSLFKAHKVDDQILPFLTYGDLKEIGVIAVGHRRKIYCSIQKLGSS